LRGVPTGKRGGIIQASGKFKGSNYQRIKVFQLPEFRGHSQVARFCKEKGEKYTRSQKKREHARLGGSERG